MVIEGGTDLSAEPTILKRMVRMTKMSGAMNMPGIPAAAER